MTPPLCRVEDQGYHDPECACDPCVDYRVSVVLAGADDAQCDGGDS